MIAAGVTRGMQARRAARRDAPLKSKSGSTHASLSVQESLDYVDTVFDDYLRYGGLGDTFLVGARVLELGPGDNYGVALRFLEAGASQVVTVDKFISDRDDAQQSRIYRSLIDRSNQDGAARINAGVRLNGGITFDPHRLRALEGVAIEEAVDHLGDDRFDLIVSRAVIEHLYDTDAAFDAMDTLLRPGGKMIHKVDFRDHGIFTRGGGHPLEFLTVSDPVFGLMSRHTGGPNRVLIGWYREKLGALGYAFDLYASHLVGIEAELIPHELVESMVAPNEVTESIERIRPRLRDRFRALPAADLAVAGAMIVAQKPPRR